MVAGEEDVLLHDHNFLAVLRFFNVSASQPTRKRLLPRQGRCRLVNVGTRYFFSSMAMRCFSFPVQLYII